MFKLRARSGISLMPVLCDDTHTHTTYTLTPCTSFTVLLYFQLSYGVCIFGISGNIDKKKFYYQLQCSELIKNSK